MFKYSVTKFVLEAESEETFKFHAESPVSVKSELADEPLKISFSLTLKV